MKGLVLKTTGSFYELRDDAGKKYTAVLRGKHKIAGLKVTNPIAVGDYVDFELEEREQKGVINKILDRENYIIRNSTHKAEHGHIIAANIDQAVLVATVSHPKTSLGFIDRFLVTCESYRIPCIVVLNKWDIQKQEDEELGLAIAYIYKSIGYEVVFTSSVTGEGIETLRGKLSGLKTLFAGHSGVGKSTLLNQIDANLHLKTGEISDFSQKGVHTTTFAEMFEIAADTFIIDTPGIKELGINEIEEHELGHYFPEFRALMHGCKFNNCRHLNEPSCAVIKALEQGRIHQTRYESYLSILENEDNRR
ncbi:MAG TPA: ribosome small subunit-dependent GTPase A [Cytophagales bacterium]|nr:ribosome small subunit-dependent GTPase A [Cytophagales bacterium]